MTWMVYGARTGRLVAQTADPVTAAVYQEQGYVVELGGAR
jgi:hypothetical protein